MNQQNKWYHAKVSPEVHANRLPHDSKLQQEQHGFSSEILYELVRETELKIIH